MPFYLISASHDGTTGHIAFRYNGDHYNGAVTEDSEFLLQGPDGEIIDLFTTPEEVLPGLDDFICGALYDGHGIESNEEAAAS